MTDPRKTVAAVNYSLATSEDLLSVRALLAACQLPTDGLELLADNCIVAKVDSKIVGTVALEPCGQAALLRSLAVASTYRACSIGRMLTLKVISYARLLGVQRLYLLTTSAERYFTELGFERLERAQAPVEIQDTAAMKANRSRWCLRVGCSSRCREYSTASRQVKSSQYHPPCRTRFGQKTLL